MNNSNPHLGSRTCRIAGAPETVDAGSALDLRVEVFSKPTTDLSGETVEFLDGSGEVVQRASLAVRKEDPAIHTTKDIRLTAPAEAGPHIWTARLAAFEDGEITYSEAMVEVPVTLEAHGIAAVVWDVPPTIRPGDMFQVKIGARCPLACDSAGWNVAVEDEAGRTLVEARAGDTPWKGTKGLHYAEVELTAPAEIGLFAWVAVVSAPNADLKHKTGRRPFSIRTAPPADAELHIRVTDAVTGLPAEGVKVAVHPLWTRTGSDGMATIEVPTGDHRVFASCKGFFPFSEMCSIESTKDIEVTLTPDPGLSEADVWA